MEVQVNAVVKKCWAQLRSISKIRKCLDTDSCKTLVHATVTSHLDYCNSLLAGCPWKLLQKLKKVQNAAARIIKCCPRSAHTTPILRELHWLPITLRIKFKLLMFVFKCKNDMAPHYLNELLEDYVPPRTLRSSSQGLLVETVPKVDTYGDFRFDVNGPQLWNNLPVSLRDITNQSTFKRALKTHFFIHHFNQAS